MTTSADVSKSLRPPLAPLLRGQPFVGVAYRMRVDPLGTMNAAAAELGDTFRMKLGPYKATLFRNPEHIRHIFVDNAANYSKQTRGYQKSKLVLGEGLVTSEGQLWQRQRRIATPAFHRQRVAAFGTTMVTATQDMLARWRAAAVNGRTEVDAFAQMMAVTLRIAVETLLGVGAGPETAALSAAVSVVLERTNDIITNPLSLPTWVPTAKNASFRVAIAKLDRFVYDAISERRRSAGVPPVASSTDHGRDARAKTDLLGMLMSARDEETGEAMSDRQLRDEAVTTLIAGHETTANALSWAVYLLAQDEAAEDELRDELSRVLSGRAPTVEDLPNLPFTRAVVEESMRLYPPAWMIGRAAIREDVIGGFRVEPGSFVLVSPYMTHRHPALWDNPDRFDPHRFTDGRSEKLPKFAYLPFGGGARFCIGATFAMMEMTLLLATIYQQVKIRLKPGFVAEPYAMITLRPRNGIATAAEWI